MKKLNIVIFANDEPKRTKGLMHIKEIEENDCAFFLFDKEKVQSFWNFQVEFPIDVAFFDSDGNFIDLKVLEAHQTEPVVSSEKAKYVIETNKGWFLKNKIKKGTSMWDLLNIEVLKKHE